MSDTSNDGLDFASSNTPANAWVPQRQVKAIDMANNVKIVAQSNPYLAQNPDLLRTIASSSNDPYQLSATSGAFGGMMAMDKLQSTFKRMSPGSQRALYSKLSDSQQRGLAEFGYQPPEDEDSAFGNFIETIAKPVKYALGGPAQLAMHTPVVGPAISTGLEGFAWVSDQTAHFYRAIRTMDTADQWLAAGGAALGVGAALLLAPETAGASLAALSPLGFGALTGATATAALTNHEDWWRAYKNSFDGERTFTQRSRDRALELVGNPMLKTMAVQIADSGFNIDDFLLEVGGQRNAQNQNTQLNAAFTMANKLASPGSAENKMIAGVMVDLMQQPLFQEAVLELQKGKISLGRDVARWVGADYGSREYNFISGGIDAVWQIAMDPTLVAGYGYKVYEAQRLGFRGLDGAAAYSKLVEIEGKEAGVLAMHQKLLDAVNNNDFEMIRRYSATTSELFMPLHNYRNQLIDAANGQAVDLTIDHWHTWLNEVTQMEPLLKGMGTKKGVRDAVILDNLSPVKQVAKEVTSKLRSFNYGLTDIRREKEYLSRLAGQQTLRGIRAGENATATGTINALRKLGTGMTSEQMMRIFTDAAELNPAGFGAVVPAEFIGDLMQSGLIEKPWLYKEANVGAREAGRAAAKYVPPLGQVGEFVTRISTLMPQRGSIALTGPRAPTDVRALTEIGQMTGMPEYTRRMWRDLIMSTTDPGQRSLAINSFLDDMLTMGGARTTEYGSQLTDEFLKRTRHIYAGGNIDEVLDPLTNVGRTTGLFDADQAVEMVIPNLSELRKITTTNFAATLLGVLDESRYGAAINNIWKPAVLLRVGFIMRAGGEEGFNFMLRGGFGRIGQTFGADSLAQYEVWKEAEKKIATNWTLPEESRLALSIEEQAAHARGPMPTHLRPFVHRMDQWGWTKPTSTYFENYRRFIHDSLERGLGFNPPMLAEAKWQGLPKAGHLTERFGQNVENITNALLFGSQYSWRRMVLGGVSDDLIETALAYERHYKTVMAREVGAMETGDWAQDRDTREIQEVWLKDQHGTERPTPVVVDYTRHQFVIPGAEGHAQAKLANARKPLEDERFRKAALPIVGTVVPPRLVAHDVVDQLEAIRGLPFELRKLAYEAIGTTSRDHVLRTIERLDVPEVLKQELKDLIPRIGEDIPWDDILTAVDKSVKTSTGWLPEQLGVRGRGAGDVMRQGREFVASLTNDERGAFNNLMRGVDPAGGHLDINFDELRAQIDNVPYSPQQRAASTRPPAKSRDQLRREQAALQQRMDNLVVPNRVDPAPTWTPEQSARYDELRSDLQAWDEWETEGAHIDDVHTQERARQLREQREDLVKEVGLHEATGSPGAADLYRQDIRDIDDDLAALENRVSHARPPDRTRKQIQDEMDALQSHLEQTTPADRDFARYQAQQISLKAQMDTATDNLRKWDQYDAAVMVQDPRYAELQNQMVPLKAHRDQLQAQYDAIEADLSRRMQNQKRYDPDSARQAQRVRKRDAVRDELRQVDGELAQMQSEMGSRAQFMGDPSVPKVLHTSLDDVRERVIDDLAAQFRGTRSVPGTPLSERAKRDLSDQSTRVYGTSYLPPVADVDQAFQDMVITATRPDLVRANEVTIKSWMTADKGQRVLVADPVLAEQMTDFARRLSPTPRAIESVEAVVPWSIVDNPNIGILAPLDRGEHKATAWTLAQDKADQMGLRPMKFTSDEWDASYNWAERQFDYMRYEWGHGVRSVQVPRSRPVAGKPGERETGLRIASADRKSYVPVDPTDRFVDNRVFLDSTDQRVSVTDHQFFNSEWVNEGMESKPMWAMLGPMIEDLSDESLGMATYLGKENMSFHAGDIVPSTDVVRRFRSSHRDLEKVEGGVDSFARREMRHEVQQDSLWKRLTRFGFDRVIGPSLEAIIRKPMAMHFFHERYQFATAMNWWRVDQGAKDAVDNVLSKVYVSADQLPPKELYELLHETRNLAVAHGEPTAAKWTNSQTAAWLRAHEPDEIRSMAEQLQRRTARGQRTAKRGGEAWKQHQLNAQTARRMLAHDETVFKAVLAPATTPEDFIALVRSQLDPDSLRSVEMATRVNKDVIENHPILKNLDNKDWDFVITLHKNLASIEKEAGDYAAIAAIGDMMPFIDSHELRSQFAQVVKPLMPFWYAEENFLKRWARTVLLDPTSIRKGQLVIQGLKNAGVVRTDESGKQWFVYPGGQIFADLFKWVPGVPDGGPLDTMFQTPLDQMLPGINGNFGAPSFSPTVTIGMDLMTNGFQELEPLERAVSGDLSASRSAWRHLVPSFLVNTMEAMFSKQTDRMANAMMTSMALQDAYGMGLDDNATEGEIDAYLDRTRSQARILSVSQALLQFLTPGPPTAVQDKEQPFFSIGGIDPTSMFKSTYATMIKQFGIEDGTARYLQIYPEHTLNDIINPDAKVTGYDRHEGIVNPVALTTSQSESTSGAPVQPTEAALAFYNDNRAFMEEFPNAGPWLLPQDDKGQRVAYVQDQQYAVGLRQRRTPEEFLRALKFKQASGLYFQQRDDYLNFVDLARERGDEQAVRNANDAWSQWADIYKTNNRIFREELEYGDGRKTRARVLDEMRIAVLDPAGPQSEHMPEMRKLMGEYDKYKLELQSVANDSTKAATQYKEDLKVAWETWAQEYVTKNPTVQGFWLSILRPESGLE